MSPTIPPVLVLSLLLVPPLPVSEAGEIMDLFALIRGTLKYWRKIYQMYEEEVILGYCWAEYFLHREADAKNNTMPLMARPLVEHPVVNHPPNLVPDFAPDFVPAVEQHGFGKFVAVNAFDEGVWSDWVTPAQGAPSYRRGKRSSRIVDAIKKRGISEIFGKDSDKYPNSAGMVSEPSARDDLTKDAKFPWRLHVLTKNDEVHRRNKRSDQGREVSTCTRDGEEVSDTLKQNFEIYSKIVEEPESISNFRSDKRLSVNINGAMNSAEVEGNLKILDKWKDPTEKAVVIDTDSTTSGIRFESNKRNSNSVSSTGNHRLRNRFSWNIRRYRKSHHGNPNSAREEISKISKKIAKTSERKISIKKSSISSTRLHGDQVNLELNKTNPTSMVSEDDDPLKYSRLPVDLREDRLSGRSPGISNSTVATIKEISKIPKNSSDRETTISDTPLESDKIKFKSNKLNSNFKSKDIDPEEDRSKHATFEDAQQNYSIRLIKQISKLSNSTISEIEGTRNVSKNISSRSTEERPLDQKPATNRYSKSGKVKLASNEQKVSVGSDTRSINCRKGLRFSFRDEVRSPSYAVPSSSAEEQRANRDNRGTLSKGGKITGIEAEFRGSQAEGDPNGKSRRNQRADTRRKLLYPRTNRATSSRVEHAERRGSRSFPVEEIASLNSRSTDSRTSVEPVDNREPDGFLRWKKFGPSNLEFQRAEHRLGRLRGNYRRNLRRKRDANDRIRGSPVRSLSKASRYNPTSPDENPRFSRRYTAPGYDVWSNGIESRSISPRNDQAAFERSVERLLGTAIDSSSKLPIYYSKQYRNTRPIDGEPTLEASSIVLRGIGSASSRQIDIRPETFRGSSNHVYLKNPSEHLGRKWETDWSKGSSSKQLLGRNDDTYWGGKRAVFVEKSIGPQTGKKPRIWHPTGRPSLLPVSYQRFMGDYGSWRGGTARNSSTSQSSAAKDQGRRSLTAKVGTRGLSAREPGVLFYLRQAFMGFLSGLGFFVNVGRQLMDFVESNSALACTKDYLVGKAIHWIDL
ncbi:unnamed protein product [Xylocopa violacea]|uniref:Uncharacterized protein n=1 Tax=Xylocopa violacea TaxID=135666 RepID=A0ABP1P2H9_XYLVO